MPNHRPTTSTRARLTPPQHPPQIPENTPACTAERPQFTAARKRNAGASAGQPRRTAPHHPENDRAAGSFFFRSRDVHPDHRRKQTGLRPGRRGSVSRATTPDRYANAMLVLEQPGCTPGNHDASENRSVRDDNAALLVSQREPAERCHLQPAKLVEALVSHIVRATPPYCRGQQPELPSGVSRHTTPQPPTNNTPPSPHAARRSADPWALNPACNRQ